ncbi:CD166 antigen homolog A [Thalassophryne amazonica]|uniref:CD166 antigen homolog A n=1 Tax=Thalassophryne amazonica TaxID=390379 RepID=UPI00147229B7|nr:CD166 antigen homolog A [Thalassophryne amazonica]
MDSAALLLVVLLSAKTFLQVRSTERIMALYGETIVIPCSGAVVPPDDLMFIKWKYEKDDGFPGDLLVRQKGKKATIQATDDYAQRVNISADSSLLITHASLKDQKTFTCMVVSETNLMEFPVSVVVYKRPAGLVVTDVAKGLQKDKLTELGTCVVEDAIPAAEIKWSKNGKPMVADGKAVVITPSMKVEPASGMTTTFSTLQYVATKEDIGATFACMYSHQLANDSLVLKTLPIHYPSEKISLQILSKLPIVEGDNVTLKCHADGNPPPNSFFFHIKEQKILVENSDTYTLPAIGRESTGDYKCSLTDNEKMEASQASLLVVNVVMNYLDLMLSPTGKVVKRVGDTLPVSVQKHASGDAKVSWTKDDKVVKAPKFNQLTFGDAGVYLCEVSVNGLVRHQSFELVVEGRPVITSLTKHRSDDGNNKVLTCEAEGVPEPIFQWSINGTNEKGSYSNGKATHKITVIPSANLTVTCAVRNSLGVDFMTINVSSVFKEDTDDRESQEDSEDQAKLIVGIVAGLLIIAAVIGLIYWLYMKNSRQGSWKTNEKEMGTSEESKKLEENHHPV